MFINRHAVFGVALLFMMVAGGALQELRETGKQKPISSVPTTHKVVALTFDDGPYPHTTEELLAVLREKKVRATFFVLGSNLEKNKELFAQTVADGHEIGSHAYSHRLLTKLSAEECERELDQAEGLISVYAPRPTLFRAPGGAYNHAVLNAARKHGYTIINWNIDPLDWQRPPVNTIAARVVGQVKPGSIVLMHDGQSRMNTPQAVAILVDQLRESGYEIVTVGELLQYYEVRN